MSAHNVALLRMAGRLVDVSGRSGQAYFEDQIRGAWASALADIPRHLAADPALAERFAHQLASAASKPQHATMLFAMVDDGGKDTIVGEFFQNAEIEQLARLGATNPDILRLLARVSDGTGAAGEAESAAAPIIEFGLASVAVPAGEPAAGSAVVTETHVFPCAWEGPDSPGVLRDLVRIHEALTRTGARKPLERYGQPQIELWLASEPNGRGPGAQRETATPVPTPAPVPAATAVPASPVQAAPAPPPAATPIPPAPPTAPVKPVVDAPVAATPPAPKAAPMPAPKLERRAVEQPAPARDPFAELAPPDAGGNRTMMFAAVGGALAVVLAGGLYFLMGSHSAKPVPVPSATSSPTVAPASAPASASAPVAVPANSRNTTGSASTQPPSAANTSRTTVESKRESAVDTKPTSLATTTTTAAPAPATAAPVASAPATAPVTTPTPAAQTPAPETGARRAAALDALGLPGQESEDKRRNALKALTGQ